MTTDSTFQFSRNQELLEEVSQFQMQILNQMMQFAGIDNNQALIQDEIDAYKVYDVWVNNGGLISPLKYHQLFHTI